MFQAANKGANDSSLSSWFSSSADVVTFLPNSSYNVTPFPHFAFFVLECEEEDTATMDLWAALVQALRARGVAEDEGVVSWNDAVTEAKEKAKQTKVNTNFLPVYRWAKALKEARTDDPMLVTFAQKFFVYYLAKPLPDTDSG